MRGPLFPGVGEFGLLEVFRRVWKTGKPERHPVALYRDARLEGWRENYVYKLPSGEIVAVYDDVTERRKMEGEIRRQAARTEALVRTASHLNAQLDLVRVLKVVCEETRAALDVPVASSCCTTTSVTCSTWPPARACHRGLPSA
ncbi:MAG: hypothetical protein AB1446_05620 [Bacillota bacterium]